MLTTQTFRNSPSLMSQYLEQNLSFLVLHCFAILYHSTNITGNNSQASRTSVLRGRVVGQAALNE